MFSDAAIVECSPYPLVLSLVTSAALFFPAAAADILAAARGCARAALRGLRACGRMLCGRSAAAPPPPPPPPRRRSTVVTLPAARVSVAASHMTSMPALSDSEASQGGGGDPVQVRTTVHVHACTHTRCVATWAGVLITLYPRTSAQQHRLRAMTCTRPMHEWLNRRGRVSGATHTD